MLRYLKYRGMRFLAPDGVSTGATGNPGANQGGATEGGGTAPVDPFAGIDVNDLDVDSRKVIEKAKEEFATLQKNFKVAEAGRLAEEQQRKIFQGKHDQLAAKLGQQNQVDPEEQLRKKVVDILISKGIPQVQAETQAPVFIELNKEFAATLKGELGRDLAPFTGSVLNQQATSAWHQAMEQDSQGRVAALQNPEVAQAVWTEVQNMVNAGQNVTPQTILNLRGMIYTDYLEKGGEPVSAMQNTPPPSRLPNVGRPTYPGGGNMPQRPMQADPNAPRYQLNAETSDAMRRVVNGEWGKFTKQFPKGGNR